MVKILRRLEVVPKLLPRLRCVCKRRGSARAPAVHESRAFRSAGRRGDASEQVPKASKSSRHCPSEFAISVHSTTERNRFELAALAETILDGERIGGGAISVAVVHKNKSEF